MPIKLNVGSEFDEVAARKAAAQAREYYARQAAELKLKAKLDVASAKEAAQEAGRTFNRDIALVNTRALRVDAILNQDAARQVMRDFERELRASKKPAIEVETKIDRDSISRATRDAVGSFRQAGSDSGSSFMSGFSGIMAKLGTALPGGLAGMGGLVVFGSLIPVLIDVAGVAASAAQSIWLLPAAAGAAGAAFGTLAIATSGFGQSLKDMGDPKKFAEDLKSLSPNAQQAALSIQALMPEFTNLKNATQDAFMAGFGQQLNQLATQYLPTIQNMTTGIASSFNQMLTGISQQLITPETQSSMQTFMNNVTAAFQALGPAAAPFTKALADIMAVGSGFLPELAQAATNAANAFSQFITKAKESGDLKKWMGEGLDTLKQLGEIAIEVGKAFMKLAPMGRDALPDILKIVKAFSDIAPPVLFIIEKMPGLWWAIKQGADQAAAFGAVFGKIKDIVEGVINFAIPLVNRLGDALNSALAPIRAAAKLIGITIPEIGHIDNLAGGGGSFGTATSENRTSRTPGGSSSYPSGGYPFPTVPGPNGWFPGPGIGFQGGPKAPRKPNADGTWGKKPTGAAATPFIDPSLFMAGDPLAGMPGAVQGSDAQKVFAADSALITATHNLEQKRLALQVLKAEGNATQQQLLTAENDIQEQERALYDAQAKDLKARTEQMKQSTSDLSAVFVPLDQGFGIAGGIPGVIKNLTILMGDLALAGAIRSSPSLQAGALALMSPQGSTSAGGATGGLLGSLFGPSGQLGPQAPGGAPSSSGMGPAAWQPGAVQSSPAGWHPAGGQPYGLPGGTNSGGYGGGGAQFPPWVNQLAAAFGVKPSTYPGHQTSDRNEAGYAPNPSHENRGIDWSGSVQNMQKFADYLATVPQSLEQVIWQNPNSGSATEIAGGRPQPGYFSGDLGGHQNHVHTRQSSPIPLPGGPGSGGSGGSGWFPPGVGISAGVGGGGGGGPGMGMPQGLGFPMGPPNIGPGPLQPGGVGAGAGIGGSGFGGPPSPGPTPGPPQIQGRSPSTSKGGTGEVGGAMLDMAVDAATTGMDTMFPGAGTAAKIGVQAAKRTIKFGGELAAIGAGGLMETFLPNGSALGDPGKSWFGRVASGVSGARPAAENTAGKTAPVAKPVDPNTKEHGSGGGQPPGPTIGEVNFHGVGNSAADQQSMIADIERQNRAHGAGMGH